MDQYLKLQNPNMWVTEVEIIATASLLAIYTFAPQGQNANGYSIHLIPFAMKCIKMNQFTDITNIANHFETVKCM